nr:hypothetical protein CFP56_29999 [Quercus suber]
MHASIAHPPEPLLRPGHVVCLASGREDTGIEECKRSREIVEALGRRSRPRTRATTARTLAASACYAVRDPDLGQTRSRAGVPLQAYVPGRMTAGRRSAHGYQAAARHSRPVLASRSHAEGVGFASMSSVGLGQRTVLIRRARSSVMRRSRIFTWQTEFVQALKLITWELVARVIAHWISPPCPTRIVRG